VDTYDMAGDLKQLQARVAQLEALAHSQQVSIQSLQCENREIREEVELLQDSLEAIRAVEEHRCSGEAAIPWEKLRAELGLAETV